MSTDPTVPATQKDLARLEGKFDVKIDALSDKVESLTKNFTLLTDNFTSFAGHIMGEIGKLYDANQRWKEEIKEQNARDLRFLEEHTRSIIKDSYHDDLENVKIRVKRLEEHTGLAA